MQVALALAWPSASPEVCRTMLSMFDSVTISSLIGARAASATLGAVPTGGSGPVVVRGDQFSLLPGPTTRPWGWNTTTRRLGGAAVWANAMRGARASSIGSDQERATRADQEAAAIDSLAHRSLRWVNASVAVIVMIAWLSVPPDAVSASPMA